MKKAIKQNIAAQPEPGELFGSTAAEPVRINKYLTACGFCSRREADRLMEENRVQVDGQPATVGAKVTPGQEVTVDGKRVDPKPRHVYIALHKPVGITCTIDPEIEGNIAEFMDYPERIFPIGRLDKDSSGLILLTSDGDIVNKILRAENDHDKEYVVKVDEELEPEFLNRMAAGVEITNMRTKEREVTKPCKVEQISPHSFRLILTQGMNRQIRRMCNELGYQVMGLRRVRIMNIQLANLKSGRWRYLTEKEMQELSRLL